MSEDDSLIGRYVAKFGSMPLDQHWHESYVALEAAMEDAIRTGKELTEARMYELQRVEPPPPDAKT